MTMIKDKSAQFVYLGFIEMNMKSYGIENSAASVLALS